MTQNITLNSTLVSTLDSILVNGESIESVSVRDRGFQFGDGLFETIAVNKSKPILWDQHIHRLKTGCDRLKLPQPNESQLLDEALSLFQGIEKGVLKIIYTRGYAERGYQRAKKTDPTRVLQRHSWPEYPEENETNGIRIRLCETTLGHNPMLAGLKHLNRLEQVIARAEWQDYSQVFEGVMLDLKGDVIAGTMTNIFFVLNNVLITPDLTNCGINGVIRELILTTQHDLNITLSVRNVGLQEFSRADEIFITNSLIGVWPVNQFNNLFYAVGPVTSHISRTIGSLMR